MWTVACSLKGTSTQCLIAWDLGNSGCSTDLRKYMVIQELL